MWSAFFCVLSVLTSLLSLGVASSAVRRANHALESRPASKDWFASQLQSVRQSLEEQSNALEVLSNRIKMTRVRNAADHVRPKKEGSSGEPDPHAEPELWRAWKNQQLRTARN